MARSKSAEQATPDTEAAEAEVGKTADVHGEEIPVAVATENEASAEPPTQGNTQSPGDKPASRRRPSALVSELDFEDAIEKSHRAKGKKRVSKWTIALERLYDATAEGKVPRGEDGALKFVRLGTYQSRNGAQQQSKALKDAVGETYEFKVTGAEDGTAGLFARVREIPAG